MSRRHRMRGGRARGAVLAVLALLALPVAGCGDDGGDRTVSGEAATTSPDASATSTGTDRVPGCETPRSVTATSASDAIKQSGSTTPAPTTSPPSSTAPTETVNELLHTQQQQLTALGYWLGPIDGRAGALTAHAVTAFQKAEGLPRTGELDEATAARLLDAAPPTAQSAAGTILEIDLSLQILLVVVDGAVTRVYDVATGAAATPTPPGQFEIDREIDGIRDAPLGRLYRPKYFNGGIALHGYTSVPPQPASHGCVRLTYAAMDDLWASGRAQVGTAVWVY